MHYALREPLRLVTRPKTGPFPGDCGPKSSNIDNRAVLGDEQASRSDLVQVSKDIRTHVGDHHAPRPQSRQVGLESAPGDVPGNDARIAGAFDNEQIRSLGVRQQRIGPLAISGIGQRNLPIRESQRGRGRARWMGDFRREHGVTEQLVAAAGLELHHVPVKPPFGCGRSWKKHLQPCVKARACTRRARDQQRAFAPALVLRIDKQEREPAEMVPVQVGDDDAVYAIEIDAAGIERDRRGSPQSINRVLFSDSTWKQVWNRPPDPKALPEPTMVSRMLMVESRCGAVAVG